MTNIQLNAEEVAALMMLYWPAPFPGGKGIGGIIPYGVKNVLKWKNGIGLNNAIKRFKKKMTSLNLWDSPELGSIAMPVLYYKKAVTIQKDKTVLKSIYFGEDLFVVIDYLENDEYLFSFKFSSDEIDLSDVNDTDLKTIYWSRDKKGKEIKDKEIKSINQNEIIEFLE